jgi:hypothetical protein
MPTTDILPAFEEPHDRYTKFHTTALALVRIFKNHPRTSEMKEEIMSIATALSNLEKEMKMIQQNRD